MSYNNFDENRPNQNNGILTDIDSINEALNILREQGLSTNFPTNTTAGMPFARLETRDDNSLQDKVVVYRRNADDDDWLKVYDEEYDIYDKISEIETSTENDLTVLNDKITDIEDGTTKVPSAENADNLTPAEGNGFLQIKKIISGEVQIDAENEEEVLAIEVSTTDFWPSILVAYNVISDLAEVQYAIKNKSISTTLQGFYVKFINVSTHDTTVRYKIFML